jgi:LCP family protein required for cell wall assembly
MAEATQPSPAVRRAAALQTRSFDSAPLRPGASPRLTPASNKRRLARTPAWLVILSALLGVLVLTCVVCSVSLALLGPERVLALRDQMLGMTTEQRVAALEQIVDVVVRGEDAWPVPGRGRLTILLMGVDRRPQQGDVPTRSDAITLITIDPASKTAAMLSIPRDLYVPLAGLDRVDRINTAYYFGEVYQLPGGGAQAAKDTIAWNLGVPLDKFVIINFEGFKRAIDALGGIDIDVPKRIVDDTYPTEDYGIERLVIEAGPTHMDGELALKYVRTRHQDSDFGRIQRQQQVILAVRDKALSLGVIGHLPTLLDAVAGLYETDLTLAEIVSVAQVWGEIPRENIGVYRIDESLTSSWSTPTGASVLIPIREAIAPIVAAFLGHSALTPVP